jgi:hypothetical protein
MTYSDCLSDGLLITIGQRCAKLETLHMFKPSRWTADPHRLPRWGRARCCRAAALEINQASLLHGSEIRPVEESD